MIEREGHWRRGSQQLPAGSIDPHDALPSIDGKDPLIERIEQGRQQGVLFLEGEETGAELLAETMDGNRQVTHLARRCQRGSSAEVSRGQPSRDVAELLDGARDGARE